MIRLSVERTKRRRRRRLERAISLVAPHLSSKSGFICSLVPVETSTSAAVTGVRGEVGSVG
ncbi:hypothetical protein C477_10383 [Haloterrigena salina JCM 13891]|uniref:Uncharacterized protein n=1 Tax=Haloterrigena salina JCM 13891 TaxID=1227488 RepID=M0C759_9EURY|nr:hypothetical protein C477_10383 [Haloterrigena salina JCM 13891]